jgi:hypothetical protein
MTGTRMIRLSVPFYRQASEFTCGPACVMMAMKFFQPSLGLNRGLEFDIWREANLVESYGTSKEGLALAAARRGFEAYTMGRSLQHSFVDAIADKIPQVDYAMLELLYDDTRRKFRAMGLRNRNLKIDLSTMKGILERSHVPILLTSTSLLRKDESPLPHWVVITGRGEKGWFLNNPLASRPDTVVSHKELRNNLGYRGVRCAVVVCGRKKAKTARRILG